MNDMFLAIILMMLGMAVFVMTLKDEKNREKKLNTSYIMHISGYVGGIGMFLVGLLLITHFIK